jgi:molybdopterin converting factor small subunit
MPEVKFTQNLQRHLSAPSSEVTGNTVREALDHAFQQNPKLRGYVLDDQGRLRKHVVVFVNGELIEDRMQLTDPLEASSEVIVMQALSGG